MPRRKLQPAALILFLAVLVVAWWLESREQQDLPGGGAPPGAPQEDAPPARSASRQGTIERLFAEKRSGVWVEGEGEIVHLLPDDRRPPRHQLCLLDLASGHTLKISHNVDLAPKVPWRKGDRLAFRGRFEWNEKGGVVHWTHHDPAGRQAGGWLRHRDRTYE